MATTTIADFYQSSIAQQRYEYELKKLRLLRQQAGMDQSQTAYTALCSPAFTSSAYYGGVNSSVSPSCSASCSASCSPSPSPAPEEEIIIKPKRKHYKFFALERLKINKHMPRLFRWCIYAGIVTLFWTFVKNAPAIVTYLAFHFIK